MWNAAKMVRRLNFIALITEVEKKKGLKSNIRIFT